MSFNFFFFSYDNKGFAGETFRIFQGAKLVKRWSILAGERDGRKQHVPATLPTKYGGTLTFCVGAQDLNNNRSPWSCATLKIS